MILQKEFYFLRHGQTDGNVSLSSKTSHGDIPLNQTGLAQAQEIEPLISLLSIKSICFSPLKRAQQTKEICCRNLGMDSLKQLEEIVQEVITLAAPIYQPKYKDLE